MSEEIKGVSPASDEDVHGIRQSILKGYRPIPLSYFKNGGYLEPGQSVKDAMSTVPIESLLARVEQDAELLREALRVLPEAREMVAALEDFPLTKSCAEAMYLTLNSIDALLAKLQRGKA